MISQRRRHSAHLGLIARFLTVTLLTLAMSAGEVQADEQPKALKVGMIGLDTSHVVVFTKLINGSDEGALKNITVVAAFPAGSPDLPTSANRIEGFTKTLREEYDIEIVDSIDELLKKVDVVLLESVDGRVHLEQAREIFKSGKPVYIDKPIAASLADTIEIFDLAKKHKVPCFSSSSMRFNKRLQSLSSDPAIGTIKRCDAGGETSPLKGHPELFFYAIHGIEMLFTVMGPGCESVTWDGDVVTGTWKGGRIGTFRKGDYVVKVTGEKGNAVGSSGGYSELISEICLFFRGGKVPVAAEDTINLIAFMTAAGESKKAGGKPVSIDRVMQAARDELAKRNERGSE